jgi:hypothetical protein
MLCVVRCALCVVRCARVIAKLKALRSRAHKEDPTTVFSTSRSCPVMFRFIMAIYMQDMC